MKMDTLDTTILELLASRICHDLISPVGAVHNGVEFLEEMGLEDGAEAIGLIAHSAQIAAARLQAFRLAYGAGGRDPGIKPEDVHKTFGALIEGDGKIVQDWNPHATSLLEPERPAGYCKMLMGCLMLAQECLPKGGKVTIEAAEDGHLTTIRASGHDVLLRDRVNEALARTLPAESLDPRLVHPYAIASLAENYGYRIEISEKSAETIAFSLSFS